jgi:methionine transaminase
MRRSTRLLAPTDVLLISDEVYEHMVFDGQHHQSAARFPGLAARAFIVSSFGKTYHVTGWKVGTVVAPAPLTAEFRKVHQFNVFTVNTPMQHALAAYMADPAPYLQLPPSTSASATCSAKAGQTRFACCPARAPTSSAWASRTWRWPNATCPKPSSASGSRARSAWRPFRLSAFYGNGFDQKVVRFCFAKKDDTLNAALQRLARL